VFLGETLFSSPLIDPARFPNFFCQHAFPVIPPSYFREAKSSPNPLARVYPACSRVYFRPLVHFVSEAMAGGGGRGGLLGDCVSEEAATLSTPGTVRCSRQCQLVWICRSKLTTTAEGCGRWQCAAEGSSNGKWATLQTRSPAAY
jgi:hypothetical protein